MQKETLMQIRRLIDSVAIERTMTLKEYINNFYLPFFKDKSLKNIGSDLCRINVILQNSLSDRNMDNISQNDIEVFFAYLQKERALERTTVNRYRARLNAIFNHAIKEKLLIDNPVSGIRKFKEQPRNRVLSNEEITRLLNACKQSRNKDLYTIVALALNTGSRCGEILTLTRSNIKDDFIELDALKTKSGYSRFIPCNEKTQTLIKEHMSTIPESRQNLFINKDIKTAFLKAKERAGLKEFRFHDIRRTFATSLKNVHTDVCDISKILGHCNITMTEKYLSYSLNNLLDSVRKIGFS